MNLLQHFTEKGKVQINNGSSFPRYFVSAQDVHIDNKTNKLKGLDMLLEFINFEIDYDYGASISLGYFEIGCDETEVEWVIPFLTINESLYSEDGFKFELDPINLVTGEDMEVLKKHFSNTKLTQHIETHLLPTY